MPTSMFGHRTQDGGHGWEAAHLNHSPRVARALSQGQPQPQPGGPLDLPSGGLLHPSKHLLSHHFLGVLGILVLPGHPHPVLLSF